MTRGKLDPGYKPETVDERLAGVDAEITRVETLQQEFGKRQGAEATQVVKWAGTYLKTLREGRRSIVGDTLIADAKHVPVQGVYVSRSKGVRSGALSLLCLLDAHGVRLQGRPARHDPALRGLQLSLRGGGGQAGAGVQGGLHRPRLVIPGRLALGDLHGVGREDAGARDDVRAVREAHRYAG